MIGGGPVHRPEGWLVDECVMYSFPLYAFSRGPIVLIAHCLKGQD